MRKMSTPVAAASRTNASVTSVGYGRVADRVAAAQQHLDRDVRDRLAQGGQPLPRVLARGSAARRRRSRRPTPRPRAAAGSCARRAAPTRDEVACAHARREQRLVRVAEGRLGHRERASARAAPRRSRPGRARSSRCARCRRAAGRSDRSSGSLLPGRDGHRLLAVRAVDRDVGEPVEDLRARGRATDWPVSSSGARR